MDTSKIKHTERRVRSPIDIALWDKAKWHGTLFVGTEKACPSMGLIYGDAKAGEQIFEGWRERFGREDKQDELRVVIVRGVSKKNPTHYGVIVGPNHSLSELEDSGAKTVFFVSRVQRMEPALTANLDRFLADYQKWGRYYLSPAQMEPQPRLLSGSLLKHHLHVRQAWELEENDPDSIALHGDDEPIIPDGVAEAPVTKTLERIRARRKRDGEQ